jgi:hypothetical protein
MSFFFINPDMEHTPKLFKPLKESLICELKYNNFVIISFSQQDRKCGYLCNLEVGLHNHCCHGKAISIKYSECVSTALVIQHARCMCCIVMLSHIFFTLSHKQHDFQDKVIEDKMCIFDFLHKIFSETLLILRRSQ